MLYVGSQKMKPMVSGSPASFMVKKPYDKEISFIRGYGTQYIDSGLKATEKTKVEIDFYVIANNSTKGRLCGNYYNTSAAFMINCSNAYTTNINYFGNKHLQLTQLLISSGGQRHVVSNSVDGVFLDGVKVGTWNYSGTFTTSGNVTILASSNSVTVPYNLENGLIGNVYSIKWWEDGVLVLDLIPVRVGQVGYFYNNINNQLYGNVGTGNFSLGPDV